ncbi:hypothetical protein NC653_020818 [Populus alba x Populus x berolinensis]|uniref:Uncharacterized protein n=1 Tax=Populus alba x Populus x berolinensis TaxID=444605 RepID=A0AAD6QD20_9ROSI|nr:hypothetical protein NC653_020818 [Populus alba x Populus x berolinensis]
MDSEIYGAAATFSHRSTFLEARPRASGQGGSLSSPSPSSVQFLSSPSPSPIQLLSVSLGLYQFLSFPCPFPFPYSLSDSRQRCNNEFEDAGHSRSARELLETFFIGELDLSATVIPELEISSKKQADCTQKLKDLTKQYRGVPVAVIGVSVVVGFLRSSAFSQGTNLVSNFE